MRKINDFCCRCLFAWLSLVFARMLVIQQKWRRNLYGNTSTQMEKSGRSSWLLKGIKHFALKFKILKFKTLNFKILNFKAFCFTWKGLKFLGYGFTKIGRKKIILPIKTSSAESDTNLRHQLSCHFFILLANQHIFSYIILKQK